MWGPEFAVAECPMETPSWCLCLTLWDRSKEGTIQDRLQKARVSEATFGSMYMQSVWTSLSERPFEIASQRKPCWFSSKEAIEVFQVPFSQGHHTSNV